MIHWRRGGGVRGRREGDSTRNKIQVNQGTWQRKLTPLQKPSTVIKPFQVLQIVFEFVSLHVQSLPQRGTLLLSSTVCCGSHVDRVWGDESIPAMHVSKVLGGCLADQHFMHSCHHPWAIHRVRRTAREDHRAQTSPVDPTVTYSPPPARHSSSAPRFDLLGESAPRWRHSSRGPRR